MDHRAARLGAREVEQVVDVRGERLGDLVDDPDLLVLLGVELAVEPVDQELRDRRQPQKCESEMAKSQKEVFRL